MNTESLQFILDTDRYVLYVRVALGCAILGVLVIGRLKGLI
jgi:hypothetical protein